METFLYWFWVTFSLVPGVEPIDPASTSPTHNVTNAKSEKGESENSLSEKTIAIIIGVGLTVVIFGSLGFFLFRGYLEQRRFHRRIQLTKIKSGSKYRPNGDTALFAEEEL